MNIENIDKAIAVMKRVQRLEEQYARRLLNMKTWQKCPEGKILQSEDEVINHCGTTCCFAGWLAVSAEFPEIEPDTYHWGIPQPTGGVEDVDPVPLLCRLLDVREGLMHHLVFNMPDNTTPADVIKVLEGWKNER